LAQALAALAWSGRRGAGVAMARRHRHPTPWSAATAVLVPWPGLAVMTTTSAPVERERASINNAHASHLILGHPGASWTTSAQLPALHAAGLSGQGQVVGLGDTGINVDSCSFKDYTKPVPYNFVGAEHRKIAAYWTLHGDAVDGPDGHGSHIAGSIASNSAALGREGSGIAPEARLAIVDLEMANRPGHYGIPENDIGGSYFDLLWHAGAAVACSPWGYTHNEALDLSVDRYAWENPEFLPIFPSGNSFGEGVSQPSSPCRAKNVLCVGASFNAREAYLAKPSFVNTAMQLGDAGCSGGGRDSCASEVAALPAFFGPTAPLEAWECDEAAASSCLSSRAGCPECAFASSALASVSDAPVAGASPADACQPLQSFPSGTVCLVDRGGGCTFAKKAHHCALAGAVGVVIRNNFGRTETLMVGQATVGQPLTLNIPVVLVSYSDAAGLLDGGRLVTFPVISRGVTHEQRVPYSNFGTAAGGRMKPEIVLPGDQIASTSADKGCGMMYMSGTSQSCGIAAGVGALTRQYLQNLADKRTARLSRPWASTLKAVLVAAARPSSGGADMMRPDVGFGMPSLAALLPLPGAGTSGLPGRLNIVQSQVDSAGPQRFCFLVDGSWTAAAAPAGALQPQFVLGWTDPPSSSGLLVHDLDLEVVCNGDGWVKRFGNGGSSPDRANTIEKVVLSEQVLAHSASSPGLCVVSVVNTAVFTPQPFALVATGPLLIQPACEAPMTRPSCGAPHGVPARVSPQGGISNGAAEWGCRCEKPWLGPFCDQAAAHLELGASALAHEATLPPWQWAFFRAMAAQGAGTYEFVVESTAGNSLLEVFAWASSEAPVLASSSLQAELTTQAWQEGGIWFSASSSVQDLVQCQLISVEVPSGSSASEFHLAIFNRGRAGPVPYTIRWQIKGSRPCPWSEGAASLRGTAAPSVAAEPELTQLVLYFLVGLAVVSLPICFCIAVKLCLDRRRRAHLLRKASPAPDVFVPPPPVVMMQENPVVVEGGRRPPAGPQVHGSRILGMAR